MIMKLLERYIAKNVLSAIGLVTLMLAGLQIFILFVNELDDLGKAEYSIWQAALYVFLQTPYQVYLFFPMASLIGCLVGLGIMANHRELVVMRAAGMSIGQVTIAVLKVAALIILLVTVIGETFVPKIAHYANDRKIQALSGGQTLRTAKGVWIRHENDFIFIATILPNTLHFVYQFRFDASDHLKLARKIDHIVYSDNHWQAYDVAETHFYAEKTASTRTASMPWDVGIRPNILSVSGSLPDEMTLKQLGQFIRAQKISHQSVISYQIDYWQRIIQPLTTVIMMVLAIPFIFGPLRSSTMGSKLLTGIMVGFGFYIMNKFLGPVSQVLQWPPEIATMGPTALFAVLGIYLMRRVR
ncbi:MAG: LPS export ABC transporter permease LptG [Tatlockia sp.]